MTWWVEGFKPLEHAEAVADSTTRYFGDKWLDQSIANIPDVVRYPDVGRLHTLTGLPAIIVAPGPSLDGNIELLRQAKGHAVIIAVSHALRALLRVGVQPDLVVVLDADASGHFDGVDPESFGGLVLPSVADEATRAIRSQRRWVYLTHGSEWLYTAFDPRDPALVYSGGTVSGAALSLALLSGCWPIALTGLDLSFRENGTVYSQHSQDRETRITWDADGYHGQCDDGLPFYVGDPVRLPAWHGGTVPSHKQFELFRHWFCHVCTAVRDKQGPIFNCTEGGVAIDGCEHVRLSEWLTGLSRCEAAIEFGLDAAMDVTESTRPERMRAHLLRLHGHLSATEAVAGVCERLADAGQTEAVLLAEKALQEAMGPLSQPLSAVQYAEFQRLQQTLKDSTDQARRLAAAKALYRLTATSAALLASELPFTLDIAE